MEWVGLLILITIFVAIVIISLALISRYWNALESLDETSRKKVEVSTVIILVLILLSFFINVSDWLNSIVLTKKAENTILAILPFVWLGYAVWFMIYSWRFKPYQKDSLPWHEQFKLNIIRAVLGEDQARQSEEYVCSNKYAKMIRLNGVIIGSLMLIAILYIFFVNR